MARPPPVHLDDLARPTFPPHVDAVLQAMAPMADGLRFEVDALLARARAETGLEDFGDEAFLDRLRVLVRAIRREAPLGAAGTAITHGQLVQLLRNRLLLQDLLRRHPEIHDVEVRRPIVIVGLPRTGTTHLHNLMAADPTFRSLPYWESLEPVLAERERPAPGEPDPRLARCEQALVFVNEAMPHFVRMHEMTTWHVHEEIQLLAIDFSTMLFETIALMPTWRDFYKTTDQTPVYAYMKTALQALQWQRPAGTRWVLKSPQHLEQVRALLATFPDAVFVFTHRDPASVVASYVTMAAYTARLNHRPPIDLPAFGRYWRDRIEDLYRACVRDRNLVPPERSIDVRFEDFMADDLAMVERIYRLGEEPLSDGGRRAMADFMAEHPRGKHGTVRYEIEQFGLDRDEIRASLAFYVDRFEVGREGRAPSSLSRRPERGDREAPSSPAGIRRPAPARCPPDRGSRSRG